MFTNILEQFMSSFVNCKLNTVNELIQDISKFINCSLVSRRGIQIREVSARGEHVDLFIERVEDVYEIKTHQSPVAQQREIQRKKDGKTKAKI